MLSGRLNDDDDDDEDDDDDDEDDDDDIYDAVFKLFQYSSQKW